MAELPADIRGVMIPVSGGRVLLPNTNVAEVITYVRPEPIPDAPDWLLGRLNWRGWHLPLLSFSMLTGQASEEKYINARVAVLKALGGRPKLPFLALLVQGFPRLTTITPDLLVSANDGMSELAGVRASVLVRDDHAVIPDLAAIEDLVSEAL